MDRRAEALNRAIVRPLIVGALIVTGAFAVTKKLDAHHQTPAPEAEVAGYFGPRTELGELPSAVRLHKQLDALSHTVKFPAHAGDPIISPADNPVRLGIELSNELKPGN
jgi:hypothetical protein